MTDIRGKKQGFTVLDEVRQRQSTYHEKIICLQRIQFDSDHRVELRLAYYIIGKKRKMRGKWVFGQFATLIPSRDLRAIIQQARRKHWL